MAPIFNRIYIPIYQKKVILIYFDFCGNITPPIDSYAIKTVAISLKPDQLSDCLSKWKPSYIVHISMYILKKE